MAAETPPERASGDSLEAELSVGAPVVHRDKHVARTAAALMIPMALLMLLATAAVASGADPAAPRLAALVPFGVFLWTAYTILTRTVVRTLVTSNDVQVHWGMSDHRVPLAAITSVEARAPSGGPTAATGAGWRLFADRGSVLIQWNDQGKTQQILFPANDPPTLAAEIERARGSVAGSAVRVAEAHSEPAEIEAREATAKKAQR